MLLVCIRTVESVNFPNMCVEKWRDAFIVNSTTARVANTIKKKNKTVLIGVENKTELHICRCQHLTVSLKAERVCSGSLHKSIRYCFVSVAIVIITFHLQA